MKKDILILQPFRQLKFQFFRDWFADACVQVGIHQKKDFSIPWNLRLVLGKLGLCFNLFKTKRLIVCSGGKPQYYSWPWCYFYDIIPVVWDCWPECHKSFFRFLKMNRVRTMFCTSSQIVEMVREKFKEIDAVWLPEGIKVSEYPKGGKLLARKIDVFEMGRRMDVIHDAIVTYKFSKKIVHCYPRGELLFPDTNSLVEAMKDTKVSICYPHCDTNPGRAGNIETLTQRYWEFMLTGTLIVGRAPRELIEICGYNPVIELCGHPAKQIESILANIDDYQCLVDKNRLTAERIGSWASRMDIILEHLK